MKRIICKLSALLTLVPFLFVFLREDLMLTIGEWNISLANREVLCLVGVITIVWLGMPFRDLCAGTWAEIAFNAMPVAFCLLLNTARWNMTYTYIYLAFFVIISIAVAWFSRKTKEDLKEIDDDVDYIDELSVQGGVMIAAALSLLPGVVWAVVYGLP